MANNERVSQLIELSAGGIQGGDLLLITDMSEKESKKVQVDSILTYIESSGSFTATNSTNAQTASYIKSSDINGIVSFASNTSQSISSSYTDKAKSSSYAETSSYALVVFNAGSTADTASFLKYTGTPNGTSSYSIKSDQSIETITAYNLFYNGQPNGTASWAMKSTSAKTADTSSYAEHLQIWYSGGVDSGYGSIDFYGASSDGFSILFSGSTDNGAAYFRTSDNGDEPFIFQTLDYASAVPVDRVRIGSYNNLYGSALMSVYGNVSANVYTSTINNDIGFVGTASCATNVVNKPVPTFISPITITSKLVVDYTPFDCSPYVPEGTSVVILEGWSSGNISTMGFIYIRTDSVSNSYVLLGYGNNVAAQGMFPIASDRTFQFSFTKAASGGTTLRLIGYY